MVVFTAEEAYGRLRVILMSNVVHYSKSSSTKGAASVPRLQPTSRHGHSRASEALPLINAARDATASCATRKVHGDDKRMEMSHLHALFKTAPAAPPQPSTRRRLGAGSMPSTPVPRSPRSPLSVVPC
eukprot:2160809-Prymnesium_polylepis.1